MATRRKMYFTFANLLLVVLSTCVFSFAYPNGALVFPDQYNYHEFPNYHHYHHNHHHHYDYDHEHDHDGPKAPATTTVSQNADDRSGREPTEATFRNAFENTTAEIPMDFLAKLNNVSYTVNDLLLHFVDDYEDKPVIHNRFGSDDNDVEERNNAVIPKDAKCMPELTTVQLAKTNDPLVVYIPSCTRIERCGGCCSHSLLSCQPSDVETLNFKVVKTQYTFGNKLKYVGQEVIQVEKHNKCVCQCRVHKEDCTPMQEYNEPACKCMCRNSDEEKKCLKNNSTRLWNPETCACQCREEKLCSTGTFYDWNQCKCALPSSPIKRRFAEYPKRDGYKSKALSVIPLQ